MNEVKEGEMARVCSMYGKYENAYKILVRNQKGRDHSEDIGADGKITVRMDLRETG
jgi:hypothetical protein